MSINSGLVDLEFRLYVRLDPSRRRGDSRPALPRGAGDRHCRGGGVRSPTVPTRRRRVSYLWPRAPRPAPRRRALIDRCTLHPLRSPPPPRLAPSTGQNSKEGRGSSCRKEMYLDSLFVVGQQASHRAPWSDYMVTF